jgi:HD-like signal output (HDOD) protein
LLAEEIAAAAMINKDFAYTAGIIHDLGRLALLAPAPQQYSTFLNAAAGTQEQILELERRQFTRDHCEAGKLLVAAWNLSTEFAEIVSRHHDAANVTRIDALACVRLGCSMADALGFAAAVSAPSPS